MTAIFAIAASGVLCYMATHVIRAKVLGVLWAWTEFDEGAS